MDPNAKPSAFRFKEKLPDIRYATAKIEGACLLYENIIFFAAVKGRFTVSKNQFSPTHKIMRQKVNNLTVAGFIFPFPELDSKKWFAFRPTERGLAWLKSGDPFFFGWGREQFPPPRHGRPAPPLYVPDLRGCDDVQLSANPSWMELLGSQG